MEKVLEKAIKKAKAYGLPMIVYENKETNYLDYCSLDVFDSEYYNAIYVDKVANIPIDYSGVMAVPITILKYMNNENKINMDKFTLCPNCTTNIPLLTISYI